MNVEQPETAPYLLETTPKEKARQEANLQQLAQRLQDLTFLSADKWFELKPNDPRREVMTQRNATRLERSRSRELIAPEMARIGLDAHSSQ